MKRKSKKAAVIGYKSFFRLTFVIISFFILSVVLLTRAFVLQTTENKKLERLAKRQHQRVEKFQAQRGSIYDRNRVQMAVSLSMPSAYVNPKMIRNKEESARKLSLILNLPEKNILKSLSGDRSFAWIKRQISPQQWQKIQTIILEGVYAQEESRRFYPNQTLAAHLLGFVGTEGKGLGGLEQRFEKILGGDQKIIRLFRDAKGRTMDLSEDLLQAQDLNGKDIVLTLDRNIQHIAERELETGIRKFRAKSGNVIVMNPENGEILALANWPTFDPNRFGESSAGARKNRAISDVFEPGSSMKVFVLAKALESGLIRKGDKIDCENGVFPVKGDIIHDVTPHEELDIADILKYSSNIGVFKIAEKFTPEGLHQVLVDFGFGEKTRIALSGESRGIVRPPQQWYGITQGTIGFGQGIAVTSLQLVRAFGALANGGLLLRPQIVHSVGISETQKQPQIVRRSISKKMAKEITEMMVRVTQEGGSGHLAAIPGFRVAGKTGTSQKSSVEGGYSKEHYVASFVGFVPAENPQLVISVVIDEPEGSGYGGVVAAPVFRRIAERSLQKLGVQPDPELLASAQDLELEPSYPVKQEQFPSVPEEPREQVSEIQSPFAKAVSLNQMPDVRGLSLRGALREMDSISARVQVVGHGIIFDQRPSAGSPVNRKEGCTLFARPRSNLSNYSGYSENSDKRKL